MLFKPWLVHLNYFGFTDVFCLSEGEKAFHACIEDGNMSDDEGEGEKDKEKKKKLKKKKKKVNTLCCLKENTFNSGGVWNSGLVHWCSD